MEEKIKKHLTGFLRYAIFFIAIKGKGNIPFLYLLIFGECKSLCGKDLWNGKGVRILHSPIRRYSLMLCRFFLIFWREKGGSPCLNKMFRQISYITIPEDIDSIFTSGRYIIKSTKKANTPICALPVLVLTRIGEELIKLLTPVAIDNYIKEICLYLQKKGLLLNMRS